jgi:hypothetical protein
VQLPQQAQPFLKAHRSEIAQGAMQRLRGRINACGASQVDHLGAAFGCEPGVTVFFPEPVLDNCRVGRNHFSGVANRGAHAAATPKGRAKVTPEDVQLADQAGNFRAQCLEARIVVCGGLRERFDPLSARGELLV